MTNGERLCINFLVAAASLDMDWWNAEYKEPTTKNDLPHCQHTDEEIAKSFIEDVEAVKDQLPCGEQMDFPNTFDEFAKDYGFRDKKEIYTNGSELIPVFRVKQWLEHISTTKNDLSVDCISREDALMCLTGKFENKEYEPSELIKMFARRIKALPSITPQETTKNDLGVDCVSRQAVDELCFRFLKANSDDNCAFYEHFLDLPSVTPIRPKGHWIRVTDKTGHLVWECDKCGWQQRFNTNFCPDCGSDNREVEE